MKMVRITSSGIKEFSTVKFYKMSDKQKLQAKLDKMLKDYEDGHSKLKKLKDAMRLLRAKIAGMPKVQIDERPDLIELNSD